MSAGKTEHLQLNQWVLDDPLLMEEVNEDNRRIDAAVELRPMVKLGEFITTEGCQQIDLDMTGIHWDDFLKVLIYWQLNHARPTPSTPMCRVRANGKSGANDYRTRQVYNYNVSTEDRDSLFVYLIHNGEGRDKLHHFETVIYPQFDDSVIYFKNNSLNGNHYYYNAGIIKTSSSNAVPAPLEGLETLNFSCYNNTTGTPALNLLSGCKFFLYGVKK